MSHLPARKIFEKKAIRNFLKAFGLSRFRLNLQDQTIVEEGNGFEFHLALTVQGMALKLSVDSLPLQAENFVALTQVFLDQMAQKAMLGQEVLEKYAEINSIFQLSTALGQARYLEEVGATILAEYKRALNCSDATIWLYRDKKRKLLIPLSGEKNSTSLFHLQIEGTWVQDQLKKNPIADIYTELANQSCPCMLIPLQTSEGILGAILLQALPEQEFTSTDLKLSTALASEATYALENSLLLEEIEGHFDGMMRGMIAAIDERDSATSGHSARISMICERFAKALNRTKSGKFADFEFTTAQLREIRYAGLLHDIGKIGVREEVLKKKNKLHQGFIEAILSRLDFLEATKQGKASPWKECVLRANTAYNLELNDLAELEKMQKTSYLDLEGKPRPLLQDSEFESLSVRHGNLTMSEVQEMRKHPEGTYKILSKIVFPKDLQNLPVIAAQHHEKLDGSGYPLGIKADKILLQSQIMCIADIYEALVAKDRPYKPPLTRAESMAIIEKEVLEGKIDGELFAIFRDNIDAIVGVGR